MAQLQADPEWVASAEARRLGHELRVRRNARDAAGLVRDLRDAGYPVDSAGELIDLGEKYHTAVPILIDWLERMENSNVLESIVRALTVPWAKPEAARPLIDSFERAEPSVRWAIASALEVVADESVYDDLIRLIADPESGHARQMLALALGKFPTHAETSIPVLLALLSDRDVNGHAIIGLRRLGADVSEAIRPFEHDDRAWVRAEAKKALSKIQRTDERRGGSR